MSCCFKPQKEKYEFSGTLGPDGPVDQNNHKKSKKAQKRHSKILMNELPSTNPGNEEIPQPKSKDTKTENINNGSSGNLIAPAVNSTDTKNNNIDISLSTTENKNPSKADKDNNEEQQSSEVVGDSSTDKPERADSSKDSSTVRDNVTDDGSALNKETVVEDSNNNSIKKGEVIVLQRNKNSKIFSGKQQKLVDKENRHSVTPIIITKSESFKTDGSKFEVKKGNVMDQDVNKEPPTNVTQYDDWKKSGEMLDVDIPEPDYEGAPNKNRPLGRSHTFNVGGKAGENSLGMPEMESKARHDINRELMLNQKLGIDVLHRKSELKKELDRRKDRETAKMKEQPRKNSLEIKLLERAKKTEGDNNNSTERQETIKEEDKQPQAEFLRIHSKIRNKSTT